MEPADERGGSWTLLTWHGHVLVAIAANPEARIRDISSVAGLTERTVQAIVADLEAAGYLTRSRTGRRTRYTVNPDSQFRHSAQKGLRVGPLLALLTEDRMTFSVRPPRDTATAGSLPGCLGPGQGWHLFAEPEGNGSACCSPRFRTMTQMSS